MQHLVGGRDSMTVYLVGAGPGDPGLLTVRGQALLQTADVIIYDRLASADLLYLARPDALLIDAGKSPDHKESTSQAWINALLVEYGAELTVVRLKGGDPFVFGRGGEEILACKAAGIPIEVVPGVTSAVAAPAYAGIPVTHRNISTSFTVVTGHENPDKPDSTINYAALAQLETLIFLMGVRSLPEITASLTAHGLAPDTPAACIECAATLHQRVLTGTAATISTIAAQNNLRPPAVIVFGKTAGLIDELAWQPHSPHAGQRVALVNQQETVRTQLLAQGVWAVSLEANDPRLLTGDFDAIIAHEPSYYP